MTKALLYAAGFAVVGLIAVALVAPLIEPAGTDDRKAGAAAFPWVVLVGGGLGFAVGWRKQKGGQ
jgi:uncharacterized membrane protein YedE/YeeE